MDELNCNLQSARCGFLQFMLGKTQVHNMVDGSSISFGHVWTEIRHLTCSTHFYLHRQQSSIRNKIQTETVLLHLRVTINELRSNINTKVYIYITMQGYTLYIYLKKKPAGVADGREC